MSAVKDASAVDHSAQLQQLSRELSREIRDDVRFSAESQRLDGSNPGNTSSSGVRFELVNRIKAEIASGTYETPDKMDIALSRMLAR